MVNETNDYTNSYSKKYPCCKDCRYCTIELRHDYGRPVRPHGLSTRVCTLTIAKRYSLIHGELTTKPLHCSQTRVMFKCGKKGKWFKPYKN